MTAFIVRYRVVLEIGTSTTVVLLSHFSEFHLCSDFDRPSDDMYPMAFVFVNMYIVYG